MNKKQGFTLIELLVVIAIIGILSSVVLASLNSARSKARDAQRISDVKQSQLALELFFDSNGQYPSSTLAVLAPDFIANVPTPPTGTTLTAYLYSGLGTGCVDYHIGAELENDDNSVLGSDSDIALNAAAATACDVGATDFAGTDTTTDANNNGDLDTAPIYDLIS